MISRVIAEFDSEQAAQNAVAQAKSNIGFVYSGSILTSPTGSPRHSLNYGNSLNTHADYLSAVVPQSYNTNYSLPVGKKYSACIICGSGAVENVISLLHAMGAENIRSAV